MNKNNKFALLTASASSLKSDVKTIALFLEVSKVLTAANINTLATIEKRNDSPPPEYDLLFSLNVNIFLGFTEDLSDACLVWFENNGFPVDDSE